MAEESQDQTAPSDSVWGAIFVLVGLAGLAFTQPVLDLMGSNPEFFVAGRYTKAQIVVFAVVVIVVPSAAGVALYLTARTLSRRVGALVHLAIVAVLGAVFGNVLLRGLGVDRTSLAVVATLVGGTSAAFLARRRGGAMLLQYLAGAQVLFLVGFLVLSPTSQLLQDGVGPEAIGDVTVPEPPGPVVVIVFDELPLSTLMRSDGTINAERYPAFARVEATSTWYRNASTVHERTERAVPAVLTGQTLESRTVPTFREMPRNLLSLLSRAMPVERYEAITDLCPPDACDERPGQSVTTALSDSLVVYGHRVLPPKLREGLAPIDNAWGEFGEAVAGGGDDQLPPEERGPLHRFREFEAAEREAVTQNRRLVEVGAGIDGSPTLHFAHVVTPHAFWSATPWGTVLMKPWPGWVEEPGEPGYEWSMLNRYQRHSLQVGSADVALGAVLDQLESTGAFDDATIVIAADHGTSTLGPDYGRDPTEANAEELYRVPLFIKAPGQQEGEVVDDPAQVLDILPTLIDLLDIEVDWEMDGHSLIDGSERTADLKVSPDVEPLFDLVRRHESHFPHGWDWVGLVAVGDHAQLVGTEVDDLEIGEPSDITWDLENEPAFASLPTEDGEVPQLIRGRIQTPDGEPPPDLVVVVNGVVAGVTGTYGVNEDGWSFSSMLGPFLVDGENTVAAYEVTEGPAGVVLHPVS